MIPRVPPSRARLDARGRGLFGLNDQMLAIIVATAFAGFMINYSFREVEVRADDVAGVDLSLASGASRAWVQENSRGLIRSFVDAPGAGGAELSGTVTMQDLVEGGYAAAGSGDVLASRFGQGATLSWRGVLRSTAVSVGAGAAPTASSGDVAGYAAAGRDVRTLYDGVYAADNDEIDIEAALLTTGGSPAPDLRAARIVAAAGVPTAGRMTMQSGDVALLGPSGRISADMTRWLDLAGAAGAAEGRFASLISLSGSGGSGSGGSGGQADLRPALLRCADLDPGADRAACEIAEDNVMHSSIVFGDPSGGGSFGIENLRRITCRDPDGSVPAGAAASGDSLTAPMQGTIVKIAVEEGQEVQAGELVLVLEAMKMEQPINAHKAGTIAGISAAVGETVSNGAVLMEIKDPA